MGSVYAILLHGVRDSSIAVGLQVSFGVTTTVFRTTLASWGKHQLLSRDQVVVGVVLVTDSLSITLVAEHQSE